MRDPEIPAARRFGTIAAAGPTVCGLSLRGSVECFDTTMWAPLRTWLHAYDDMRGGTRSGRASSSA